MKKTGKIFAAGCLIVSMMAPVTAYGVTGTAAQVSAREGVPVVTAPQSSYENVAISRVSNYVNVRTEPNTTSAIVGKIYNNCAATILATVDGEGGSWYQIQSGTVQGYIKAEYFITGAEAEKVAKEVGTVYVTINTQTLRLREEPNTESKTLTLLSEDAEYIELKEEGDFVQIQVDSDLSGYVHKDYIEQRVEFQTAVSLEEEQQQIEESERLKREADEAIARVEELKQAAESGTAPGDAAGNGSGSGDTGNTSGSAAETKPVESIGLIAANPNGAEAGASQTTAPTAEGIQPNGNAGTQSGTGQPAEAVEDESGQAAAGPGAEPAAGETFGPGYSGSSSGAGSSEAPSSSPLTASQELASATRTAIVAYARQFLGNPYVYGGTSLTDGADCSGFVMSIFAHFGIDTGRSSRDQAANAREISLSEIQPGDLLFYASGDYINHVALYIGGGQVIHASTEKTGIVISPAYYRTPYKAATFLD